jgi:hypothetical protein
MGSGSIVPPPPASDTQIKPQPIPSNTEMITRFTLVIENTLQSFFHHFEKLCTKQIRKQGKDMASNFSE